MHKNKISRVTASFLSLCLVLSFFISAATFAAAAETSLVEISTAKQLNELSKRCSTASYSENLEVILLNNIDLKGGDFSPIPIFNGVFSKNSNIS